MPSPTPSDPLQRYQAAASAVADARSGSLFGKPCFKLHGKAFVCFFQDQMVFKLTGDSHTEALALAGASLFDPSGKGRPMKAWVQVPADHSPQWPALAQQAAAGLPG